MNASQIPPLQTIPLSSLKRRAVPHAGRPFDQLGRALRDLRVSVTDRCNFRCTYCMPRESFGREHAFLPRSALLSFEEIARLARVFAGLGVQKIRLTGGEPLLRKNLPHLIELLASIPNLELTLTTNGALLARHAAELKSAGLHRLTVSLDSLDDAIFRRMCDADFAVSEVLRGIEAADAVGFTGIKINMVVRRGINDAGIVDFARHFRGTSHIARFIEYMDVGETNGWRMDDVVSATEVVERIAAHWPLTPVDQNYRGEVAKRWRYLDGAGEIGVIASVTQAFCQDCNRLRMSPEGKLFTCLFATSGHELMPLLRDAASDEEIAAWIASIWAQRGDRYSALRGEGQAPAGKIEMSYIGG